MRSEFPKRVRLAAWERAQGHCETCGVKIRLGLGPHYDHVIPDAVGGEPTLENCAVLCRTCHGVKTAQRDVPAIAKTKRVRDKAVGAKEKRSRPMPGTKASGLRKRMNGSVERWK